MYVRKNLVKAPLVVFFSAAIAFCLLPVRNLFPDIENYLFHFREINYDNIFVIEYSYIFISRVCYYLLEDNGFQLLLFIYLFVSLSLKLSFIKEISTNFFILAFIYFSYLFNVHDLIQIRAGLACAFLFYGLVKYLNTKNKTYLLIMGIAPLFHSQALIFLLLMYLVRAVELSRFKILFLVITSFVVGLFFPFILSLFITISSYLPGDIAFKLLRASHGAVGVSIVNPHTLFIVILFTPYLFMNKFGDSEIERVGLKCLLIGLCIFIAFRYVNIFAWRNLDMFLYSALMIVPFWILKFSKRHLAVSVVVLYGVVNFYLSYSRFF